MKHITTLLLALVALFSLSSCLRDTAWEEQEHGLRIEDLETKKIIEVYSVPTSKTVALLADTPTKEIKLLTINLAAKEPAAEDITVSLGTTYEGLSEGQLKFAQSEISIPSSVVIKAGTRQVDVMATVNTASLIADPQSIRVGITAVDKPGYIISGNYQYLTLNFMVMSKWEGIYDVKVYANPFTGEFVFEELEAYTITPTKVGSLLLPGVYSNEMYLIFDDATNTVVGAETPGLGNAVVKDSSYDEATNSWTFTVVLVDFYGYPIKYTYTRKD